MAFKVELNGTGYRISTGDGRPAQARDIPEVHRALDHYYAPAVHGSQFDDACPFCRQMAATAQATGG